MHMCIYMKYKYDINRIGKRKKMSKKGKSKWIDHRVHMFDLHALSFWLAKVKKKKKKMSDTTLERAVYTSVLGGKCISED